MPDMSDIHLDVTAGRDHSVPVPLEDTPFRIALLGDFSGRDHRPAAERGSALATRRTWRVDRDDLDETLAELAPELVLTLAPGDPPLRLRFEKLDDFHPDQLMARVPLLSGLGDLRRRLRQADTFAEAARELSGEATPRPARPPKGSGSLLDDILDDAVPPSADEALADAGGDLYAFIQRVMRPHLVPNSDPRQAELVAQVDAAATATLRAILHAPAFQALEAAWRAVDLLVRRVETGTELQLHLVDLSANELAAALPHDGDPRESPLFAMLTRQSGSAPWALLSGAYAFDQSPPALDRLAQVAAIAQLLGAPFIAEAHPSLAGARDVAELGDHRSWKPEADAAWTAFRAMTLARYVGLVLPGFLVRVPYGKAHEACETVNFEEYDAEIAHDQGPWAPGAFAVALVLARAFSEGGWTLGAALDPEIGGLPFVVTGLAADRRTLPVGRVLLTEAAGDDLLARGLMPLATLKDSDRVRLVRLQSLAHPLAALVGRWK